MSKPESEKCSVSHPSPAQTNLDAEKYRPHVHTSHGSFHTTKRKSSEIEHVAEPTSVTPDKLKQGAADVKRFLSWLTTEQKASASSQNLAFNALLFVYRHVLGQEFGKVDGVVLI